MSKKAKVPGTRALNTYEVARQLGDPILHRPCKVIEDWNPKIREFGMRLKLHVIRDPGSIGLAANQLGIPWSMLAYRDTVKGNVHVLTNPTIIEMSTERYTDLEGCFSVKQGMVMVERSVKVKVHACDLRGAPVTVDASGLAARALQHEIDHLMGKTIAEHGPILTSEQAREIRIAQQREREAVSAR